jgi:beta-1,4-mannosyltransferase
MAGSVQSFLPKYTPPSSSPFTWLQPSPQNLLTLRSDRPALVITSTSWTLDEDFDMLLRALRVYEQRAKQLREMKLNARLPKILMIVTGKGPLRYAYVDKIAKLQMEEQWEFVRCVSLWVEAADYPLLLGESA